MDGVNNVEAVAQHANLPIIARNVIQGTIWSMGVVYHVEEVVQYVQIPIIASNVFQQETI